MKFNGEQLKFDRKHSCDWCGKYTTVAITHYGTTHYNRLICEGCVKTIKNNERKK